MTTSWPLDASGCCSVLRSHITCCQKLFFGGKKRKQAFCLRESESCSFSYMPTFLQVARSGKPTVEEDVRCAHVQRVYSLCSDRKGENRSDGLHGAVEVQDAKRGDTAGDTCLVDSREGDTCCYCCNCAMFGSRLDRLFCTKRQKGCTIEAFVKKWGGVAHKRQRGKLMKHKHDSRCL